MSKNPDLHNLRKFLRCRDLWELEQVEKEVFIQDNIYGSGRLGLANEFRSRLHTDENACRFWSNFGRGYRDEDYIEKP